MDKEKCPKCLQDLKRSICRLFRESQREGLCEEMFMKQLTGELSPKDFVNWLKAQGIRESDFFRALEESEEL